MSLYLPLSIDNSADCNICSIHKITEFNKSMSSVARFASTINPSFGKPATLAIAIALASCSGSDSNLFVSQPQPSSGLDFPVSQQHSSFFVATSPALYIGANSFDNSETLDFSILGFATGAVAATLPSSVTMSLNDGTAVEEALNRDEGDVFWKFTPADFAADTLNYGRNTLAGKLHYGASGSSSLDFQIDLLRGDLARYVAVAPYTYDASGNLKIVALDAVTGDVYTFDYSTGATQGVRESATLPGSQRFKEPADLVVVESADTAYVLDKNDNSIWALSLTTPSAPQQVAISNTGDMAEIVAIDYDADVGGQLFLLDAGNKKVFVLPVAGGVASELVLTGDTNFKSVRDLSLYAPSSGERTLFVLDAHRNERLFQVDLLAANLVSSFELTIQNPQTDASGNLIVDASGNVVGELAVESVSSLNSSFISINADRENDYLYIFDRDQGIYATDLSTAINQCDNLDGDGNPRTSEFSQYRGDLRLLFGPTAPFISNLTAISSFSSRAAIRSNIPGSAGDDLEQLVFADNRSGIISNVDLSPISRVPVDASGNVDCATGAITLGTNGLRNLFPGGAGISENIVGIAFNSNLVPVPVDASGNEVAESTTAFASGITLDFPVATTTSRFNLSGGFEEIVGFEATGNRLVSVSTQAVGSSLQFGARSELLDSSGNTLTDSSGNIILDDQFRKRIVNAGAIGTFSETVFGVADDTFNTEQALSLGSIGFVVVDKESDRLVGVSNDNLGPRVIISDNDDADVLPAESFEDTQDLVVYRKSRIDSSGNLVLEDEAVFEDLAYVLKPDSLLEVQLPDRVYTSLTTNRDMVEHYVENGGEVALEEISPMDSREVFNHNCGAFSDEVAIALYTRIDESFLQTGADLFVVNEDGSQAHIIDLHVYLDNPTQPAPCRSVALGGYSTFVDIADIGVVPQSLSNDTNIAELFLLDSNGKAIYSREIDLTTVNDGDSFNVEALTVSGSKGGGVALVDPVGLAIDGRLDRVFVYDNGLGSLITVDALKRSDDGNLDGAPDPTGTRSGDRVIALPGTSMYCGIGQPYNYVDSEGVSQTSIQSCDFVDAEQ